MPALSAAHQATNELEGNHLRGMEEESSGEDWEVLGECDGYGSDVCGVGRGY